MVIQELMLKDNDHKVVTFNLKTSSKPLKGPWASALTLLGLYHALIDHQCVKAAAE